MKNLIILYLILAILSPIKLYAQNKEPEFIGEAFVIKSDSTTVSLGKEIAEYSIGLSWSSNSWNATSIELREDKSKVRFSSNEILKLVVRAVDNNSDPLTIISIYKFKAKKNKRTVVLSVDNSGTLMKSRTNTKDLVLFQGKKFGNSSYLLDLGQLRIGEYGIIVANPNNKDEKRTVVTCFGIE